MKVKHSMCCFRILVPDKYDLKPGVGKLRKKGVWASWYLRVWWELCTNTCFFSNIKILWCAHTWLLGLNYGGQQVRIRFFFKLKNELQLTQMNVVWCIESVSFIVSTSSIFKLLYILKLNELPELHVLKEMHLHSNNVVYV